MGGTNFTNPKTRGEAESAPDVDPIVSQIAVAVAAAMGPLMAQMQQSNAQTIAALLDGQREGNADALKAARGSKRPESFLGDFPFPNTSHWAPNGEKLEPLRCETFLGYVETDEFTGNQSIIPGYPFVADEHGGCTAEERTLLNALEAGVYTARRRDGAQGEVRVQIRRDTDGAPFRVIVAVPKAWLGRLEKNALGGVELLKQLTPANRRERAEAAA